MPWNLLTAAAGIVLLTAMCGCGGYTGAAPRFGYNTEPVSYEPPPNPDAISMEIPSVDPRVLPDPPLPLPDPRVWTPKMPIAFVGEIQRPPDTTGTSVSVEISQIYPDGSLGQAQERRIVARVKKRRQGMPYRIEVAAPSSPGRYHVAIKTLGPSIDLANLDTFAEGDVEVR